MNAIVLVAVHKPCELPQDDLYLPIQVNATENERFLAVTDNEGDNIGPLNPKYSELTALYYGWKNIQSEYIGLTHYRRYLSLHKSNSLDAVLTKQQALQLLSKHKLLLSKKRNYYVETLYSHYSHTFDEEHLIKTKQVILELCPEYIPSFDSALSKRSGYMFNIIIGEKQLIDEYCGWLFPILFELDKRIDDSTMSGFEKRYIGRIAERLFNVWLDFQFRTGTIQKADLKELPYVYLGKEPWAKKVIAFLVAKLLHKKYKQSF